MFPICLNNFIIHFFRLNYDKDIHIKRVYTSYDFRVRGLLHPHYVPDFCYEKDTGEISSFDDIVLIFNNLKILVLSKHRHTLYNDENEPIREEPNRWVYNTWRGCIGVKEIRWDSDNFFIKIPDYHIYDKDNTDSDINPEIILEVLDTLFDTRTTNDSGGFENKFTYGLFVAKLLLKPDVR